LDQDPRHTEVADGPFLPIVDRPSDLVGRSEDTILPVAAQEPAIVMTDYQFYSLALAFVSTTLLY
jgi:hypothetical protein